MPSQTKVILKINTSNKETEKPAMARKVHEYQITVKLAEPVEANPRWTPEREGRNIEKLVRSELRLEYPVKDVRAVKAEVKSQ